MSERVRLPIDPSLPEIVRSLEEANCLVLQASPGSGKTTRVPPALLGARFRAADAEILVLEPRRLAAKYAARRVADELREPLGGTVGYQFRFENVSGPRTRLRFLTEGMLMRRLIRDPRLEGVAAVILDEFHERHLHSDIALAYLRRLQTAERPELRILVMSATLDTEAVASHLGASRVIHVEARVHEVTTRFLPSSPSKRLESLVREAVSSGLETRDGPKGDFLVFLPGMADIRRAESELSELARARGILVLPLHGELSREEQDLAIQRAGRTKIVLATNVAETSLTIDGITNVIDSGLHRIASYSWWSGVPALRTRPISRASAIQRAGRAGRTAPGTCVRLYTKADFDGRPLFETPEVSRADLTQTYLELKRLGVQDPDGFPWFERPATHALQAARELLFRLGALGSASPDGAITPLGARLAELPAHPRLGRLLVEAERRGVLPDAATLAALLSEGELEGLDALAMLDRPRQDPGVERARAHLLSAFSKSGDARTSAPPSERRARLAFALLAGFPDRVARKRGRAGETELVFSSGGSSRVEDSGVLSEAEFFVTLDIQEVQRQGQARAQLKTRSVAPIREEWLFDLDPSPISETEELTWDQERGRVQASSRMTYGELVLAESRAEPADLERLLRVVLRSALGADPERAPSLHARDWIPVLARAGDPEVIEAAFARVGLVAPAALENPWPGVRSLLEGKLSTAELREIDWAEAIPSALAPDLTGQFDRLTPVHLQLPSGRRARIHYKLGQPPWVESRLQDFFGMKKGPAILGGKLPLTLHLLAPNQRAVQVTQDLEGFWARAYPAIRKELSRRYPKHAWPEDP